LQFLSEEQNVSYQDILYESERGVVTITINRPEVHNAFRNATCEELIDAFRQAAWDKEVGVVVLTGTGGDQKAHEAGSGYGGRGTIGLPVEELHSIIRDTPKPVVAKVRGYAIGGGNVLAVLCDLTLASENAVFGQIGPKVGSVDPGFGTAYLARVVGEKKAREMWYLCRRYSAQEALAMGLVNCVVPDDQLDAETDRWCTEIMARSPTALALAKRSLNADSESIRGLSSLGMQALALYYQSVESREGVHAFQEKRPPDFRKHAR
jgi:2-ketocyclohexanecarboxyl-CoA hydrolase